MPRRRLNGTFWGPDEGLLFVGIAYSHGDSLENPPLYTAWLFRVTISVA